MKATPRFNSKPTSTNRFNQRGIATVEFALIASLLFTLLFGVMEMSRVLFYWNTATEATRMGARLAVVCSPGAAEGIKTKMHSMLNVLDTNHINIQYLDKDLNNCSSDPKICRFVTVSITGLTVSTVIPLVPLNITMPPFSTTLPRESLTSILKDGSANPDCA